MTYDLRAACKSQVKDLFHQWWLSTEEATLPNITGQSEAEWEQLEQMIVDALLRFAQQQRKAGIKDVIDHCEENIKPLPSGSVVRAVYMAVADWCEARAQAVTQGDGKENG